MIWRAAERDERLALLRGLPELEGVSARGLRDLSRSFDEAVVPAGTLLARAGDPCAQYLVVMSGSLTVEGTAASQRVEAGASLGWRAMSCRGLNPATVAAASDARLLVMGRAQFRAMAGLNSPDRVRTAEMTAERVLPELRR